MSTENKVKLTRRDFLKIAGPLVGGTIACSTARSLLKGGDATPAATPDSAVTFNSLYGTANADNATLRADNATLGAQPKAGATEPATQVATDATSEKEVQGNWAIEYFKGATDQMKNWTFQNLDPVNWPDFPNVDNPRVGFVAANGLEYGMDESLFAHNNTGDLVVDARGYALYTGDYDIPGIDSYSTEEKRGGGILVVNVGEISSNFERSTFNNGFVVRGRYWNGDELPQAVSGVLSHAAHNMLNLSGGDLNPGGDSTNAGANCSVPGGCKSVRMVFAIVSGNELLVKGVTEVGR